MVTISLEALQEWKSGIPLEYCAPQLCPCERNFLNYGHWREKMTCVTGVDSVVDYMANELSFVRSKARDLCDKHKDIIEQGVRSREFPYFVAEQVIEAEETLINDILPEDYFNNDAMDES